MRASGHLHDGEDRFHNIGCETVVQKPLFDYGGGGEPLTTAVRVRISANDAVHHLDAHARSR